MALQMPTGRKLEQKECKIHALVHTHTHISCTMQTHMVIQMQTKEANEKPYKHRCNHGYKTHIDMHVHEAPVCYRRSISLKRTPCVAEEALMMMMMKFTVLHKKHKKKPSSSSSS
jgi:hypothetical protein